MGQYTCGCILHALEDGAWFCGIERLSRARESMSVVVSGFLELGPLWMCGILSWWEDWTIWGRWRWNDGGHHVVDQEHRQDTRRLVGSRD